MNEPTEIRVQARKDDFGEHVLLRIYRVDTKKHTAEAMVTSNFVPASDGVFVFSDVDHIVLTTNEAQRIVDQLWDMGFRPTEGAGSAGQAKAMQAHIADLQSANQQLVRFVDKLITPYPLHMEGEVRYAGGSLEK